MRRANDGAVLPSREMPMAPARGTFDFRFLYAYAKIRSWDMDHLMRISFRRQLANYTEAELIKLGRSCSSAASRWLDPMTQQLNASKYELCRQEWSRRHPKAATEGG